jgi:hypothetical protein
MVKIEISNVSTFTLAWNDKGSGGNKDGAFYTPINIPLCFLGDV